MYAHPTPMSQQKQYAVQQLSLVTNNLCVYGVGKGRAQHWATPPNTYIALLVCSLFNQVVLHPDKLLCSAEKCSNTVREIFRHFSVFCYTSFCYNKLVGPKFAKVYSEADIETGIIIRSIRFSEV